MPSSWSSQQFPLSHMEEVTGVVIGDMVESEDMVDTEDLVDTEVVDSGEIFI